MSTLLFIAFGAGAYAHEVMPSVADMERQGDQLVFDIRLNAESFVSGVDQGSVTDTNNSPQAAEYDRLRALPPADIAAEFGAFWPEMAKSIDVSFDGADAVLNLQNVTTVAADNEESPRITNLRFSADVPAEAKEVTVSWAREYGGLALRQIGVDAPFERYLAAGEASPSINLAGGNQAGPWRTFIDYIPVGFDHIVPKGLDHILFVLGLFFLSTRMGPLLWQISAFTLAHTITLALAALGYVSVPGSIVEPLIALSIVYVAVENLYTEGLSPWRPFVIFGFGLLHGLGFASVLAEFGLPDNAFIPALVGFNIGVEIGQLAVIAVAYICVYKAVENARNGDADRTLSIMYLVAMFAVIALLIPLSGLESYGDLVPLVAATAIVLGLCSGTADIARFGGYREIVAVPGSILIAVVAAYWCVERVFL